MNQSHILSYLIYQLCAKEEEKLSILRMRMYRCKVLVGFMVMNQIIMNWEFSAVIFKCMRNVPIAELKSI